MAILGFPHFHRPKEKPKLWGPPDAVAYAIRDWCEHKLGASVPTVAVPMWEGAGNIAHDYSGNQAHGTFLSTVEPYWTGKGLYFPIASFGYVLNFGTGNRALNPLSAMTIFSACRPTENSKAILLGLYDGASSVDDSYILWPYDVNKVEFWVRNNAGSSWITAQAASTIILNQDCSWGGSYDGNNIKAFYNGISGTPTAHTEQMRDNVNQKVYMGGNTGSRDFEYEGDVYCLYVWDVGLSDDQMALLHDQPYAMFEPVSRPSYFFASSAVSAVTDIFDGKLVIKNSVTNLLDGKAVIKSANTDLLDGKVLIQNIDTDLLDGKVIVKDVATILLDGKVVIKDIDTDLFDGKIIVKNIDTDLLDGKVIISAIEATVTNLLDGNLVITIGTFPIGHVTIQFDTKKPEISFAGKAPEIIFTGKKPEITFQ